MAVLGALLTGCQLSQRIDDWVFWAIFFVHLLDIWFWFHCNISAWVFTMTGDLFSATVDEWQRAIDQLTEPDEELKEILVRCQLAARGTCLTERADAIEDLMELLVITRGNWSEAS